MEHLRPLASRVGDHQADVVLAKQCDELAGHEARMTDLHSVAKLPVGVDRQARAADHPAVTPARERERLLGGTRQQPEEGFETLALEREHRRKLPEKRAELVAQVEDAGGEEVGERLRDPRQPQHVRDVA